MKKNLLFIPFAAVAAVGIVSAQKLTAAEVPAKAKAAFAKTHPGISAKWEKEDADFEAGFKQDGKAMTEVYKADGTLLESEVDIKTSELPATVQSYVKSHYKNATIKEAAKITKADGTVNFEAEVNKMDVVFDAAGKFLKEVKD